MKKDNDKNIQEELGELYPLLKNIEVHRPIAPEGYFDTLPDRVVSHIKHEQQSRSTKKQSYRWLHISGVAASLAILIGVYLLQYSSNTIILEDEIYSYYIETGDFSDIDEWTLSNLTDFSDSDDDIEYIFNEGLDDIDDDLFLENY